MNVTIKSLPELSQNILYHIRTQKPGIQQLENYIDLVRRYKGNDWTSYLHAQNMFKFKEKTNYKKFRVLESTENPSQTFDMYVLEWEPQRESPIHNHAKYGCIQHILKGTLFEKRYSPEMDYLWGRELPTGSVGYMDNHMGFHRIGNATDDIAYSLHIYSPANYHTKFFL